MEDPNKLTPNEGTQGEPTPEPNLEPEPQIQTPSEPEPEPQPEPDYKTKFAESTREAQILAERNKQLEERLNSLTITSLPNDDELRANMPDWDEFSDEGKSILKRQYMVEKIAAEAQRIALDILENKKWGEDLVRTLTEFPDLKGREEEFKKFAYKPTHKGVDLKVLAKSFLFDIKKDTPAPPSVPGLEKGSGGPKDTPTELTPEQISEIRTKDPKRYRQMLLDGKIK